MKTRKDCIKGQMRHGDVLVEYVGNALPATKKDEIPTLAEGEFSGHYHRIFGGAVMFRDDGLARDLGENAYIGTVNVPVAKAELKHVNREGELTGEHSTLNLPEGKYVSIAQREYDPEEERRAAD